MLSTFGVAAGAVALGRLLTAQAAEPSGANAAQASAVPKPPYLISVTDHLGIVFEADESALKSLLPPNLKPAAGSTVGLNMYRAEQVVGLLPYAASYLSRANRGSPPVIQSHPRRAWSFAHGCNHAHCPTMCEDLQPFFDREERFICSRCWFERRETAEMLPCHRKTCVRQLNG
jgi:hypothetical protein